MRYAYLHGFASGPKSRRGQRLAEVFRAEGRELALPDLNAPSFAKLSLGAMLERLDALDDEFFDSVLQTNVRGAFATVRAFRRLLAVDGGGLVVNISSLAAKSAGGSNIAYSASKAAMDNLTLSLARALAPEIRVVSVAPGLVDTEFTRGWNPAVRQRNIDHTPLGRLATPEDVGQAVVAVATDLTFVTGIVIPVDGGRPLGS